MRKTFDFNNQIKIMNDIFQSNISLAETANVYIKRIRPDYLSRAIKQLKMDYQWLYLKQDGDKFNSIRSTLHLIAKQRVTNIDELFMSLGEQINSYYGVKYMDLKKKIPYSKQCQYCHRYVSNYQDGLQSHQQKCTQKCSNTKKTAPKNNQGNSIDKKYRSRKNKLEKEKETQRKDACQDTRLSKKQSLLAKIDRKCQQVQRTKNDKVYNRRKSLNYDKFNENTDVLQSTDQKISKQNKYLEDQQQSKISIPLASSLTKKLTSSSLTTELDSNDFFIDEK